MAPELAPELAVELAPAKINLFLHVTGRRADGYHLLDSLVVFSDIGDRLTGILADRPGLQLTGPMAAGLEAGAPADNLVWKAAEAVTAFRGDRGHTAKAALLTLEKHLPVASGIGGGSSDAAAAIRLLTGLWSLPARAGVLHELALGLGADVPVCLAARPTRMGGIGEVLAPAPEMPDMPAVLVNPGVAVPTGAIFKALDLAACADHPAPEMPERFTDLRSLTAFLAETRNDLEAPAKALAPEISSCLDSLQGTDGVLLARMSGSGATCFGVYPEAETAERAAAALIAAHPDWWVKAGMFWGRPMPTRLGV